MQLSHLLEELLLKHEFVFVPQLGQLSYKTTTAGIHGDTFVPAKRKLELDVFNLQDDGLLTALISRKLEISIDDAKEKRNQIIDAAVSEIKNNSPLTLKGIGKIVFNNGFQTQEISVASIPSDFFGLNSIDSASASISGNSLYDFESKKMDESPIKNVEQEIQKVIEKPVTPVKYIVEEDDTPTEIKTIDDLFPYEHPAPQNIEQIINEEVSQVVSIDATIPQEEMPNEEHIQEDIEKVETEFAIENETISNWVEEIEASHQEEFIEAPETIDEINEPQETDESLLADVEMQEKETILESILIENEHIDDAEEESVEQIKYIDTVANENVKRRLNRYDDDLDYVITPSKTDEDSNSGGWLKVAALLFLFFGLAVLIPWIYATMQCQNFIGLKPLWNANCKTITIEKSKDTSKAPIAQRMDSVSKDTSNNLVAFPSEVIAKKPETVTNNSTPAKNETQAPAAVSGENKKVTSKENTKELASNTNKKEVKSTENLSKENVVKKPKEEAPTKLPKGATVSYKKGLTYVCFGTFNNVNTANRLRSELRSLEVLTETVFIDGTYRVVIPYVNRKYAEKSAEDFPNTIIFE